MGQLFSGLGGGSSTTTPAATPTPAAQNIPMGLAHSLANMQPGGASESTNGGLGGYLLPARTQAYLPAIGAGAPQVGYGTWVPPRTAVPGLSPQSAIPGTSWRVGAQTGFVGQNTGGSTPTSQAPTTTTGIIGTSQKLTPISQLQAQWKAMTPEQQKAQMVDPYWYPYTEF